MQNTPTLAPLIGRWQTQGEVFGDDGQTVVGTIAGTDVYEWLGPTVLHHVDVLMDGRRTRALEIFEPYSSERGGFVSRAHDDQGGVETALACVHEGAWTFHSGAADATLTLADDGSSMEALWTLLASDGQRRPWMRLRFTRCLIPAGFNTVTPYYFVKDAESFVSFLVNGLGGEETCRTMRDGQIQNVQVRLGTSTVMVSEATQNYPAMAAAYYLYVSDADAAMQRAIESGASLEMAVQDMPYGDRQGGVRDQHGNIWWISQRTVDEPYAP